MPSPSSLPLCRTSLVEEGRIGVPDGFGSVTSVALSRNGRRCAAIGSEKKVCSLFRSFRAMAEVRGGEKTRRSGVPTRRRRGRRTGQGRREKRGPARARAKGEETKGRATHSAHACDSSML